MKNPSLRCLFRAALFLIAQCAALAVDVDMSKFRSSTDFSVSRAGDELTMDWNGEGDLALRLKLNLAAADRIIAELSHGAAKDSPHKVILQDAAPAYWAYIGRRHGTWEDSYFDNPSSRPHEISQHFSKLLIESARVESDATRLRIAIPGLWMGFFYGDLVFTLYAGSNLVRQEAVVATQEPNIAYYYDAWLTHCNTNQLNRLLWAER